MDPVINNVQDMLSKMDKLMPDAALYRGQCEDWPLLPTIGRYAKLARQYENWRVFHDDLIERFVRDGSPYLHPAPADDYETWVVAQHHGVPTRLLDMTTNPVKALYFAVNDPSREDSDGVLWAFAFKSWRTALSGEHRKYWDDKLEVLYPSQLHPRLTAQEGAFLCCPMPEDTAPLSPIQALEHKDLNWMKFVIPSKQKARIRHEIGILGAKHRLLFPDLDGVARGIQLWAIATERDL